MRIHVATALALVPLCSTALALADDTPPPPVTTQTTVTTTPPAPATGATSTTTTTQAAVDTTPAPPTPMPAPPESGGSETTTYVNRPLLATGLVLLGGTYIGSVSVAAESDRPADRPNLYIPVAGPWIDLGQRGCTAALPCSNETGNKALLVLDGVGQGVGTLALLTSFFVPEKKSRHWFFIGSEKLNFTPSTIGTGYGLTTAGAF